MNPEFSSAVIVATAPPEPEIAVSEKNGLFAISCTYLLDLDSTDGSDLAVFHRNRNGGTRWIYLLRLDVLFVLWIPRIRYAHASCTILPQLFAPSIVQVAFVDACAQLSISDPLATAV